MNFDQEKVEINSENEYNDALIWLYDHIANDDDDFEKLDKIAEAIEKWEELHYFPKGYVELKGD